MAERDLIVYVDRSAVREGAMDDLEPAMAELADFVETNVPDILAYNVYFSGDEEQMTVIHVHDDQSSLERHMEVAGPKFPPIGEFVDMESIDVYGHLDDELVRQLRAKASELGNGRVAVHDVHCGVDRITDESV
ncbi:hypothetical protein ACFQS4_21025 [Saliphagus sp. GCM10025317]